MLLDVGVVQEGESDASGHHSDYYENDDGFIDDTEVHEFFGGDWHKPKHSGFYINQVTSLLSGHKSRISNTSLLTKDCQIIG